MNWRKLLLGDSTKYDAFDPEALADNRYSYYSIIISFMILILIVAYLIIAGFSFKIWVAVLIVGLLFICMLLLMKLNNFAFIALNTYLKEKGKK